MRASITSAMGRAVRRLGILGLSLTATVVVAACSTHGGEPPKTSALAESGNYLIGPGDSLQIFVWRNPDLSTTVPVRPDGRISIPLVEDIDSSGKTPSQLARDIEGKLKKFVTDPVVTVIVSSFVGPFSQQVRVVGEASEPKAIPYRQKHVGARCDDRNRRADALCGGQPGDTGAHRGRAPDELHVAAWRSAERRRHVGQCAAAAGRCDHHPAVLLLSACP